MTLNLDIKFNNSYYKKTNKQIFKQITQEAVSETIQYAETEARKTAPIKTGNLRASHSTRITNESAQLVNNCGYASYVAFGTSRQAAQNYPLTIVKNIQQNQLPGKLIKNKLENVL